MTTSNLLSIITINVCLTIIINNLFNLLKGDMRLKFASDNLLRTWTGWKRTEQLEVFFRVNWLQNQSNLTVYRGNDISTGVNILAVEKRIKNRHVKSHKLKFWVFKNNMRNSQSCVRSVTI